MYTHLSHCIHQNSNKTLNPVFSIKLDIPNNPTIFVQTHFIIIPGLAHPISDRIFFFSFPSFYATQARNGFQESDLGSIYSLLCIYNICIRMWFPLQVLSGSSNLLHIEEDIFFLVIRSVHAKDEAGVEGILSRYDVH